MSEKPKRSLSRLKKEVEKVTVEDSLDKKADEALKNEKVADHASLRLLREEYAKKLFHYLICYSVAAYILLLLHGFKLFGFQLDSTSLAVVVGSTAASAISLVGIVAKGLFGGSNK